MNKQASNNYKEQNNNKPVIATTTIEEIFRYELLFIKLCGGFLFEWPPKFIRVLYQASIILLTKVFAINYYSFQTQADDSMKRAALQNVRLFRYTYLVVSYVTVLLNFLTALKYDQLLLVIMKKRLDKRYLDKFECHCQCNRNPYTMSCGSAETAVVGADGKPAAADKPTSGHPIKEAPEPTKKQIGARRVKIVRNLLIANVLLNALTTYLWHNATKSRSLPGQPLASQVANKSSLSVGFATFETSPTTTNTPINREFIEPSTTAVAVEATITTTMAITPLEQTPNPSEPSNLAFDRLHTLWAHHWQPIMLIASRLSQNLLKFSFFGLNLAKLLYEFSQAALNINQTYGQLHVVLIIVATLTDMLSYSRLYDALVSDEKLQELNNFTQCDSCRMSLDQTGSTLSNDGMRQRRPKRRSRSTLLTTELLVQIRDVLIVLRCTNSLNYLGALIYDLTRIGTIFCLFYTAIQTDSFDTVLSLFLQYILVAFSMALTGLGYHWLHQEVLNLRRFIDERNLLEYSAGSEVGRRYYFVGDSLISQPERITTCRLADDIGKLWPTDWFTPDFKSYLKSNILVITLVATLQQLVEAGMRSRDSGLSVNG